MNTRRALIALAALTLLSATPAYGKSSASGDWTAPVNLETIPGTSPELNTPYTDGCPIQAPDGKSLYLASNRPGGLGGIDIWVARRDGKRDAWGPPENLGAPVNSSFDDFCPTPTKSNKLFFVSSRDGGCGVHPTGDIYVTRLGRRGFSEPENLGCEVNSPGAEASPSWVKEGRARVLYFSSNRPGGLATEPPDDADIYRAELGRDGTFDAPEFVTELNTAADDARPNVRKDGLEIVFDSTRPGTLGGPDIYAATRKRVQDPWGEPVNLGPTVNTPDAETRASLLWPVWSWHGWQGTTLVFGSNRPGSEVGPDGTTRSTDIYVTTRERCERGRNGCNR